MINLFIANLKMLTRNRQRLFWSFMFPLMFTVIFGFFFGKGSFSAGTIILINNSQSQLAETIDKSFDSSELFKVKRDVNETTARDLIKKNQVSAILIIPDGFGDAKPDVPTNIKMVVDPGNAQSNSVITGYVGQFLTQTNFAVQNAKPIYGIEQENTTTAKFNYFDFILIGLLGMALMNSNIQGISISMTKYREDQILKRITTTPLPAWKFIGAEVLAQIILNMLQVGLILAVGIWGFKGHVNGSYPIIFALSLLGAVLFQLIGFSVAATAKNTQAAEGMSTAIAIPMMFLAGVFFPIDQLPKWLYSIIQYLPLAPLLRMIRTVGLEASSPLDNPINIAIVCGWIVVLSFYAIWRFKLSDE